MDANSPRQRFVLIAGDDDGSTGAVALMLADLCDLVVRAGPRDIVRDEELRAPDLVIVDETAGGAPGLDAVELVRTRFARHVPALLMTADAQRGREALMSGFEGIVVKPLQREQVLRAVRYLTPSK